MKSKFLAVIFTILILIFTFLRENFLVAINAIIAKKDFNRAYFYWFNNFFSKLDNYELLLAKWFTTITFIIIIVFLTLMVIYVLFGIVNTILVLKGYILIAFFMFILFVTTTIFGVYDELYFLQRKILGFIQSPIPLFVVFVVLNYKNKAMNIK